MAVPAACGVSRRDRCAIRREPHGRGQSPGEVGGCLKAVRGRLGEGPQDGLLHRCGDGLPELAERARRLGQAAGHGGLRSRTRERRLAGEHLIENGCQRVDVRPCIYVARAEGLLGAHVCRRAHCHARFGQLVVTPRQRSRDAEVGHQCTAVLGEEDILRLDVAVHHTMLVGVFQRAGGFMQRCGAQSRPGAAAPGASGHGATRPRQTAW